MLPECWLRMFLECKIIRAVRSVAAGGQQQSLRSEYIHLPSPLPSLPTKLSLLAGYCPGRIHTNSDTQTKLSRMKKYFAPQTWVSLLWYQDSFLSGFVLRQMMTIRCEHEIWFVYWSKFNHLQFVLRDSVAGGHTTQDDNKSGGVRGGCSPSHHL